MGFRILVNPRALTLVGLALAQGSSAMEGKNHEEEDHEERMNTHKGGRDRARRALRKALVLDPFCWRALYALVDLTLEDGQYEEAIDLLKSGLEGVLVANKKEKGGQLLHAQNKRVDYHALSMHEHHDIEHHRDLLASKLADVYAANKNYSESLSLYHKALSWNPENIDAY